LVDDVARNYPVLGLPPASAVANESTYAVTAGSDASRFHQAGGPRPLLQLVGEGAPDL
jgi:hypothetical protein